MSGWLTTIVARVSLNMLKSRASRQEELTDVTADAADASADPERETLLADSVGGGRATAARPAVIGGAVGLVRAPAGRPGVAFRFTLEDGRSTAIDLQADLAEADIVMPRNRVREQKMER